MYKVERIAPFRNQYVEAMHYTKAPSLVMLRHCESSALAQKDAAAHNGDFTKCNATSAQCAFAEHCGSWGRVRLYAKAKAREGHYFTNTWNAYQDNKLATIIRIDNTIVNSIGIDQLTTSACCTSAPRATSLSTTPVRPLQAANINAVRPCYTGKKMVKYLLGGCWCMKKLVWTNSVIAMHPFLFQLWWN